MEKISVAVRFRPSSVPEAAADRHWKVEENRISFHRPLGTPVSGLAFAFDHVFDQETTNEGVYGLLIKSIIDAAVQGFNGTAFAYGQTSSGKTFTMNGSDTEPGITQLAVRDVFHCIQSIREREFLIRVSYMEIYNEEINDLLSLGNEKLPIHESLERGIFVAGLREEIVNSEEQVLKLIKLGEANRRFGETNMNVRSSRSHTIFRMVIESSLKQSVSLGDVANADAIRVSVLNLVDLAGSERIAKTGAGGVRLKEGKYINKSLMTLGNVINKLSENGKQRAHIPYRDSKLTRILQLSLGGNAKTSIICTVAPEEVHMEETRGTLQFASRAKRVTNCAQVNEILTDAALLKRQKLEIEELRRKLQEGSNSEVLEQVILKQRNDMLKSEYEREKLAMELEEEKRSREALEQRVREQQMTIDELSAGYRVSDQDITSTGNLDHHDNFQEDGFQTPNFKSLPTDFVSKRSTYSVQNDSSPIPEILANVVDEEQWLQLNEGHTTDIDLLQMTPTKPQISQPPETYVEPAVVDGPATEEGCKCPISECVTKNELLEAAKQKCTTIEKECNLLKEENASLSKALSMSAETVELLTNEKEQMLNDLTIERQKMKDLKEEIRMFGLAFAQRENSLTSLYAKSKAMVENLKTCHVPKN